MDDFEKKTPEAFEDTSEKANAAQNCADGFKEERSAAEHSAAEQKPAEEGENPATTYSFGKYSQNGRPPESQPAFNAAEHPENAQSSGNFGGSGQNAGQYGGQSAAEPGNGQNPAQNNGQNTAGGAAYGQYTPPRQNYYGGPYYGQRGQYGGYYRPNTPPPPYGYNRYPYGQYYNNSQPAPAPAKKGMSKGLIAFICIVCCVAVGVMGLSAGMLITRSDPSADNGSMSLIEDGSKDGSPSDFDIKTEGQSDRTMTYEQVITAVQNSVVSITVYNASGSAAAQASGIVMDTDGYILTNDHIYAEVPNAAFLISMADGTNYKASFVSGDTRNDLAILKMESHGDLTPATFATEAVKTGEEVLAIGASAGLEGSVTQGIVSAVDRRVSNGTTSEKYIQTTAAINPGASGGALVNMSGQVVGVCSSKYASTDIDNVCFAIPMTRALGVIDQLKKYGAVTNRAKLGITYTYINTVTAEMNNMPTGLLVKSVDSDSNLYGKINKNDVITKVDDTDIVSADQVLNIVESAAVGDEVALTVYNGSTGAYFDVTAKFIKASSGSSYTTGDDTASYNTQNPYDFFGDENNNKK